MWVGNIAGKVAEIVANWGTYSRPRTAKPIIAPIALVPISMYIGIASTNKPIKDPHHIGFRPTRSDRAPAKGRKTIIANCPMIGTISAPFSSRPISPCR